MAQEPWIVALISTDYDLEDERSAIRTILSENGMEVSAFEDPSFPVVEGVHSHENCIKALNRADFAILLIKERYGGKYFLDQEESITEAEYKSLDIPTIVFVHRKTWDERCIYRRQQKASKMNEEDFAHSGQYTADKIDINTIQFVNRIQSIYTTAGRSNWINFWDNLEDLKKQLPAAMSSRSSTVIQWILERQIDEVKKRRTSTGLSMPLGDVIDKGYYIEPEYELLAGSIGFPESPTESIVNKLLERKSCLALGEAGSGKTTLMANCFLTIADSAKDKQYFFPGFIWLKSMKPLSSFSIEEYLQVSCEKYLHKNVYPFFKLDGFNFVFFLDGFDELAEKLSKDELHNLYSSEIFSRPIFMTSRLQYGERYLTSNDFTSKFDCCLKLTDWTNDTSEKYIKRFCELQGKGEEFEEKIMGLLVHNHDLQDVLTSPLLITILLYVIEHNRMQIPETIRSRTQLFEECFDKLAQREIETKIKAAETIPNNQDLVINWAFFAWMLYESKLMGEKSVHFSDATSKITEYIRTPIFDWPVGVNEVIFDIKANFVFDTLHEQFLEYLVAYFMEYACINDSPPYPYFLKYVMRPEINRYFRGIIKNKTEAERKMVFDRIKAVYWECAGSKTTDDILKRVHAVYHMSRLDSKNADEEINRIFNSESERAVKLSLFFGVIKKGDLARERELFDLLNNDSE